MKKLKILTRYLIIGLLLIYTTNCREELITLTPPQIKIISVEEIAFGDFEIEVELNIGERQEIKKTEVILEDITITSSPKIIKNIQIIEAQNQIIKVLIDNAKPNHDYKAQAVITTSKYEYISEFKIIRASKNNFSLEIVEDKYYTDLENGISKIVGKGDSFNLILYFQSDIKDKELEIKLDKTIDVDHTLVFSGKYAENWGNKELIGQVNLPSDIESKDYELYAYIDGIEIKANSKIRIIKGTWDILNESFPGAELVNRAWFLLENELYIVGGALNKRTEPLNFPVWKYDFINDEWKQLKDFPTTGYTGGSRIWPISISANSEGYIIFRKDDEIGLWKYNKDDDSWRLLSFYPGQGQAYPITFTLKNKLYWGGGKYNSGGLTEEAYDFWSYDFYQNKWNKLQSLPNNMYTSECLSCNALQSGYVMEPHGRNRLWRYDKANDSWSIMSRFKGGQRSLFNIVNYRDNIYIIGGDDVSAGGITYKDCWEFSTAENKWNLNSFLSKPSEDGIAFTWNDKLIYGMGSYTNWDREIDSNLYNLNIE